MKDKGSREAPFFLLKISHRNAYRQANIFKVFGICAVHRKTCTQTGHVYGVFLSKRMARESTATDMLPKLGSSVYVLPFSFVRQISVFMR